MGPLLNSFGSKSISIIVDYISKWFEEVITKSNDNKCIIKFLKENIFSLVSLEL